MYVPRVPPVIAITVLNSVVLVELVSATDTSKLTSAVATGVALSRDQLSTVASEEKINGKDNCVITHGRIHNKFVFDFCSDGHCRV